jgi:hypothetical protein
MLIVFGIRHVTLQRHKAHEFGFNDPSWSNTEIEAAQRYFHLLYIPFFPLDKIYGIRGTDRQLYKVTPQVETQIRSYKLNYRTPWYTFSGLILLLGALMIFSIMERKKGERQARLSEEGTTNYNTTLTEMMEHPSLFDYYEFEIDTSAEKSTGTYQIKAVYRVIGFNRDSIRFRSANEDPFSYFGDSRYDTWLAKFNDTTSYNPFWLKKADMKRAWGPAAKEVYSLDDAKMEMLGKQRYIRITGAHVIDGPEFKLLITSRHLGIMIHVVTTVDTAETVSFKKISGEGTWNVVEGSNGPRNHYFDIYGNTESLENFSGRLECTDKKGKPHAFLITPRPDYENEFIIKKIK